MLVVNLGLAPKAEAEAAFAWHSVLAPTCNCLASQLLLVRHWLPGAGSYQSAQAALFS